jgi:hypothetical protein
MPSPLALALTQLQQAAPPPQVGVAPTDVAQIYKNTQDAALAAWKAKLDQQAALWGNLAKLGGASISAFGPPIAGQLFRPANTTPVDY